MSRDEEKKQREAFLNIQKHQIWEEKARPMRRVKVLDIGLKGVRMWTRRVGSVARRDGHGHGYYLYPRVEHHTRMFLRRFVRSE